MNKILIFSKDIKLDTLFSARIKTAEIPAGTAFVTLYDNELNPVAERMIFLNADRKMKVQIGVSKPNTRPGSETELTINTTDEKGNNISSIISVSAIDSSLGFYNGIPYSDIESLFLFDTEFYNNLPQSIRCTGLKNADNKTIDLLMMTYGWRKYTFKETAMVIHEKRKDNYDHLKISNPGKDKKGREVINILSPEGGEILTLRLNENMETLLPFDSLDVMARQIMILPDDDPARNSNPVNIEFPENREYADSAKLMKTDFPYSEADFVSVNNDQTLFNPDSSIMIDPITIKGTRKKPTEHVAKTAEEYKYAGALTLYSKDFKGEQTFEDILYKLNAFRINKYYKTIVLRTIQFKDKIGIGYVYRPALVVVDDVPIYTKTYSPIAQMPTSDIASITVVRGTQGFSRYGENAANGVVIVTTKTGNRINGIIDPNDKPEPVDNNLKQVRIFRSEVEYYTPTKEQVEIVPEYQFRPTLLWKSDVYLDGSGPVLFKYPNNMGKGTVLIFVNGVSMTNLVGSGKGSYNIR
ncbi:MAG: TonB-dependent receptor plug domain-containing protein [Bacteroidetes bacterium]|nr:TonB-dependent receptor plug domain-containing protein [Bacteroidota bacterium]